MIGWFNMFYLSCFVDEWFERSAVIGQFLKTQKQLMRQFLFLFLMFCVHKRKRKFLKVHLQQEFEISHFFGGFGVKKKSLFCLFALFHISVKCFKGSSYFNNHILSFFIFFFFLIALLE